MIITTSVEFDAGHRVLGHLGKCRYLHGHRYKAEISVSGARLDELGMVVDFGIIRQEAKNWIDRNWDHNMILNPEDPLFELGPRDSAALVGRDPYVMPDYAPNPTAENMAHVLFNEMRDVLYSNTELHSVRIWETPNCSAIYTPKFV